jgi:pentatricopeptide repeat protein
LGQDIDVECWKQLRESFLNFTANKQSEGVELAWQHTVVARHYTPDEGLLANVLNVAARTGNPDMVTRVLDILPVLSVQPEEYHLVALMEAYVKAGKVPQALQVLSMVRSVGLKPTRNTAQPILDVLTTPELVDQAFFALEDMKAQGQTIDITAFNVLVEASSRLEDVQRVRATQMAASDLGVVPDIDTFNSALAVCIPAKHRALGDTIMEEMKQAGISPNGQTYHYMILICLTQAKYDDAFFYLETSKSEGFKPQAEAYRQLAMRCSSSSDGRAKMVIAEMESLGYKMEFSREHQRGSETGDRGGRREFGERRGNTGRGGFGVGREGGGSGAGVSNRFVAGTRREDGRDGLPRREGTQPRRGGQPREGGQRREGGSRQGSARGDGAPRTEGGQRRRTDDGSGNTEPTART